jgi:hypothetical protein
VGSAAETYLRVLQLNARSEVGSFLVRPLSRDHISVDGSGHPWSNRIGPTTLSLPDGITVADARLRLFANSKFPVGDADGAVWQGRGITAALDGGVVVRFRSLTVSVLPTLLYTQNRSFDLAPVTVSGMPVYAYPWHRIDLPQRFGPSDFWSLDPGQSEVRLDAWGASVGFGTASSWWGPGVRNAIVMSDNAPGFPHGFVGTSAPLETGIGGLEGRWIWGRLQESDWFDPSSVSDERFITGIAVAYSPSFIEGLSLGMSRIFYVLVSPPGVPLGDYFAVLRGVRKKALATPQNPSGDDEHDQIVSLFGRWVLEESGLEVYWEWARNDHSWSLRDFLMEPEHSQAYTLGLRKALDMSGNRIAIMTAELTHLEADPTFQVRSKGTYYTHHLVTQGYTHRGQVIGAAVGPAGNAQHVGVDLYAPWGRAGAYLERQVHDNDAYYAWAAANDASFCCHDVSVHLGMNALLFVDAFDLGAGLIATREYNRYFFGLDLWNLNLSLSARWRAQRFPF